MRGAPIRERAPMFDDDDDVCYSSLQHQKSKLSITSNSELSSTTF